MAKSSCCGEAEKVTLVFASAGASNVGQITNEAAKQLETDGLGRYFCLAGIGGKISGMIESTKAAGGILALDGCDLALRARDVEERGIQAHGVPTGDRPGHRQGAQVRAPARRRQQDRREGEGACSGEEQRVGMFVRSALVKNR